MDDAPPSAERDVHATVDSETPPLTGELLRSIGGGIGALLLVVLLLLALVRADDATKVSLRDVAQSPSGDHVLGTDPLGRDQLARIAASLRDTARVAGLATLLFGGFAVLMGTIGAVVRRLLPDRLPFRWSIGVLAGLAWLAFVHWLWRLPIVTDTDRGSLSDTVIHGVHDGTLAQVSGRLFAATCIGVAGSLAMGGLRWRDGRGQHALRHVVGAGALLFGLGCASLAVVDAMRMLDLGEPSPAIQGVYLSQRAARGVGEWWQGWPVLATVVVILVACALIGAWLMASRASDPDGPGARSWQHSGAIALTCVGIAFALWRQLALTTMSGDTAAAMQWVAATCVLVAVALLVVGRVRRGSRGVDLGTATWFVLGAALAVLLHWPAQHNLDTTVERELRDHPGVLALLEHGR